jgi:hypothetical protein
LQSPEEVSGLSGSDRLQGSGKKVLGLKDLSGRSAKKDRPQAWKVAGSDSVDGLTGF